MSRPNSSQPTLVRDARGFGMFEVTLILAAIVLVTAALTPAVLRNIQQSRHDAARAELESLYAAIVGSDADGTWGYVGDMGRMPADLGELLQRGSLASFATSADTGVGYGWNGPYLNRGRDIADYRTDPWGKPYDIGVVGTGQLRSAGPNGVYDDGDDLVYPPSPVVIYGTLIVSVKGHSGDMVVTDPTGCSVSLHYADEGSDASVVDDTVPYSFETVHRGMHTVQVSCPRLDTGAMASETAVVTVRGGGAQQVAELHVELGMLAAGSPTASESETDSLMDAIETRLWPEQR